MPLEPKCWASIEAGVADIQDVSLKERIAGLKAMRDQAQADIERAKAALDGAGQQAITPAMLARFGEAARERLRIEGGGYRRDHLRALTQRVEVADKEVSIMGSKTVLLKTLAAATGGLPATGGVPASVLKWRPQGESNPCSRRERAVS